MITVLAGGVGAARFLRGLVEVVDPSEITAVVNTADDFVLHGLSICPDLDTVRATVTDDVGELGWGRSDESWRAMQELSTLKKVAPSGSRATDWFSLGDRDLAIHLYRTQRMQEGASLTRVTAELCEAAGLHLHLLPMTDDPVRTRITLESGDEVDFQEYFVVKRHSVPVTDVRFAGVETAKPAPGVLDAIERAERIVIAPSNPVVSIAPVLAVPGIAGAVQHRRDHVVAISPIIGGHALKGPADRMLSELGHLASAAGIARIWSPYASTLVVDLADQGLMDAVAEQGVRPVATSTIMSDTARAAALAEDVVHLSLT